MSEDMTAHKRAIRRDDILPAEIYARDRARYRREAIAAKANRQLAVGPFATLTFESFRSMWHQVQEMLHIEKGGPGQIEDELKAYNPLIPNGRELVATLLLEIEDEQRRRVVLGTLGGIERSAFIRFDSETIMAAPEADQERTDETGKASAVQFLHFPFAPTQIEKFRRPGTEVTIGFKHPHYAHMTQLPEAVRAALSGDFA